jgi:hypothetical protein
LAYNTKNIKLDLAGKGIPQFFDTAADDYYALLGTNGAGPHYVNVDTSGVELFTAANPGHVQLTGSSIDLRGLASAKPLATAVDIGVTYWSVDTGAIEVSDGTNWVVV